MQQAIDILDEMINELMKLSTREFTKKDPINLLEEAKSRIQALPDGWPTDSDCIEFIKKSINENPTQVLQWLLLNIGNSMWEMNADTITTGSDMNNPRWWRMRVEMKIEKLSPKQ